MKATAKSVPKTNKMADTNLVVLAIIFFMIDFPIDPISGHITIISHISILVKRFFERKDIFGRERQLGESLSLILLSFYGFGAIRGLMRVRAGFD